MLPTSYPAWCRITRNHPQYHHVSPIGPSGVGFVIDHSRQVWRLPLGAASRWMAPGFSGRIYHSATWSRIVVRWSLTNQDMVVLLNRAIEIVDLPKKGWFSILSTDSCHKKGWLIWGSFYDMKIWHKATEDLGGFVSSSYRMMFSTRLSGFCHGFDPWPTWKLASPCLATGPPLVGVLGQRACNNFMWLTFFLNMCAMVIRVIPIFSIHPRIGIYIPIMFGFPLLDHIIPQQKATVWPWQIQNTWQWNACWISPGYPLDMSKLLLKLWP